ncbi:hypothetical protein HK100_009028 [Physocladia obscura]|uniref:Galactose oxidase n=1 Tax=Physocladia obscura TaxID=109957 RepID=A0AAD5XAD1_9FUNG|nr:hypothetical protein HK100_009028 [Physocladia obscura]
MRAKWTTFFKATAKAAAPTEAPIGRSSHSVNVTGNSRVLVFGGEELPRVPIPINKSNSGGGFETFDLTTRKWISHPTVKTTSSSESLIIPEPRVGHATAQIGNTVYLLGGRGGADMSPFESTLFAFNYESGNWNILAPPDAPNSPPARSYHAMAASANHIFVFGGCPATGRLNDLIRFDPASKQWSHPIAPHPDLSQRGGPGLAVLGSRLVLFGGFNGKELGDMWTINISDDATKTDKYEWKPVSFENNDTTTTAIPGKRSVAGFVALPALDAVVLFHGERDPSERGHEGAGKYNDDVWVFRFTSDPNAEVQTGVWERCDVEVDDVGGQGEVDVGPTARGWISAAAWQGDKVVMVGGFDGTVRDNGVYVLSFN